MFKMFIILKTGWQEFAACHPFFRPIMAHISKGPRSWTPISLPLP